VSKSYDHTARMAQILGQPPRMAPLPPGAVDGRGLELVERLRRANAAQAPGEVHETFRTLFRHHEATRAYLEMGVLLTFEPALAPRDKELAILRTAWLCGSPVAWGEHIEPARNAGLDTAEIERLTLGSGADGWREEDRAIVSAAEELHADAMISDETWALLAARLDERQLIELLMVVGHYHMTAYLQNALRFPVRESNPGLSAR
jgi:alkylhydroperoxidase family enzyme